MSGAVRKYVEFHQHEPHKIGSFHPDMTIPPRVILVGDAVNVMYRSDKLNPTTGEDEGWLDYIHEHSSGVHIYRCDRAARGADVAVPSWIRDQRELTWLGDSLGFVASAGGKETEGVATAPLPELYTIPSGKALLVIQGKRKVLAMIWGGNLRVERRGIVH